MPRRLPLILVLALTLCATASALAQPDHVSYQGSLLKNGVPYDGSAQFKFAVVCAGTEIVWSNEDLSGDPPATSVSITVDRGVFSVLLGGEQGMPPLTADLLCDNPQLRVWVDTGEGFEQMPDQLFSSAAFALRSALAAGGGVNDGDWIVTGDDMYAGVSGSVGIGTASPNSSALLDLQSQTKGFLPPRLTEQERDAIAAPVEGLVIYNTTTACLNYYAAGAWLQLCGSPPCEVDECDAGETMCGPEGFSTCLVNGLGCGVWVTTSCDDGDACTVDSCDPIQGCVHEPVICDDGIDCTVDLCDPATGDCVFEPMHDYCDDGNPCTTAICDPNQGGCTVVPVPDGTACGVDEFCVGGLCVPCANSGGATCATSLNLGTMCGDEGAGIFQQGGCGEGWFRVFLEECDMTPLVSNDLEFRAWFPVNPAGDYRVELHSPSCGQPYGTTVGGGVEARATVPDNLGFDDSRTIYVRVYPSTGVVVNGQDWTLRLEANWQ